MRGATAGLTVESRTIYSGPADEETLEARLRRLTKYAHADVVLHPNLCVFMKKKKFYSLNVEALRQFSIY